jgi:hypothetical protein
LKSDIPIDPQSLPDSEIDALAALYSYGPPPLTDAEVAANEEIFKWKHPEMESLILRAIDPRLSEHERAAAKKRIAEIRGC